MITLIAVRGDWKARAARYRSIRSTLLPRSINVAVDRELISGQQSMSAAAFSDALVAKLKAQGLIEPAKARLYRPELISFRQSRLKYTG